MIRGRVGEDLNDPWTKLIPPSRARELARGAGLRILSTLYTATNGDLTRVKQVISLTGFVNAHESFTKQGAVINGCSEVLIEALGPDRGVGVRVCAGTGSLHAAVSVDVIVELKQ